MTIGSKYIPSFTEQAFQKIFSSDSKGKYDVYLTGSDQVWNTDYLKGDTSFFFSFLTSKDKIVSYAASFGRFSFSGDNARKWLDNLRHYTSISVRENQAKNIINEYIGKEADVVLDPTLLLTKEEWTEFSGREPMIKRQYILVYVLTYAWQPFPYALSVVKHFEKLFGWEVVVVEPLSLKTRKPDWTYIENASPQEFVNLINHAGLVITTSFHGTAFSINLETPFYAIAKDNAVNDDRISSLCNNVLMTNHLIKHNAQIPGHLVNDFDNSKITLDRLRSTSQKFLSQSISSCAVLR